MLSNDAAKRLSAKTDEYIYAGSREKKCAVCGFQSYAYLTNTYFCGRHFDLALRRTMTISEINRKANAKNASPYDRWFRDDMFRKQPDVHNNTKWLKYYDGADVN